MARFSDIANNAFNSIIRELKNAQANNLITDVTITGIIPPIWKIKIKNLKEYYGDRAKLAE
jgi:hypothetical protein